MDEQDQAHLPSHERESMKRIEKEFTNTNRIHKIAAKNQPAPCGHFVGGPWKRIHALGVAHGEETEFKAVLSRIEREHCYRCPQPTKLQLQQWLAPYFIVTMNGTVVRTELRGSHSALNKQNGFARIVRSNKKKIQIIGTLTLDLGRDNGESPMTLGELRDEIAKRNPDRARIAATLLDARRPVVAQKARVPSLRVLFGDRAHNREVKEAMKRPDLYEVETINDGEGKRTVIRDLGEDQEFAEFMVDRARSAPSGRRVREYRDDHESYLAALISVPDPRHEASVSSAGLLMGGIHPNPGPATHKRLSDKAALRYFLKSKPPQRTASRGEIIVRLIRAGVEPNPGPPRLARKCGYCKCATHTIMVCPALLKKKARQNKIKPALAEPMPVPPLEQLEGMTVAGAAAAADPEGHLAAIDAAHAVVGTVAAPVAALGGAAAGVEAAEVVPVHPDFDGCERDESDKRDAIIAEWQTQYDVYLLKCADETSQFVKFLGLEHVYTGSLRKKFTSRFADITYSGVMRHEGGLSLAMGSFENLHRSCVPEHMRGWIEGNRDTYEIMRQPSDAQHPAPYNIVLFPAYRISTMGLFRSLWMILVVMSLWYFFATEEREPSKAYAVPLCIVTGAYALKHFITIVKWCSESNSARWIWYGWGIGYFERFTDGVIFRRTIAAMIVYTICRFVYVQHCLASLVDRECAAFSKPCYITLEGESTREIARYTLKNSIETECLAFFVCYVVCLCLWCFGISRPFDMVWFQKRHVFQRLDITVEPESVRILQDVRCPSAKYTTLKALPVMARFVLTRLSYSRKFGQWVESELLDQVCDVRLFMDCRRVVDPTSDPKQFTQLCMNTLRQQSQVYNHPEEERWFVSVFRSAYAMVAADESYRVAKTWFPDFVAADTCKAGVSTVTKRTASH